MKRRGGANTIRIVEGKGSGTRDGQERGAALENNNRKAKRGQRGEKRKGRTNEGRPEINREREEKRIKQNYKAVCEKWDETRRRGKGAEPQGPRAKTSVPAPASLRRCRYIGLDRYGEASWACR